MIITTSKKHGVIVLFTAPATSDTVDGVGTATCTPASGSLFPVGVTTVTCTATGLTWQQRGTCHLPCHS
ncbi:MAG: HYR domain-containing protein [Candidatus Moduliflexus flocculans]|nr:HYR domain-containing protein [Candidatus Moduliflexus flocculans]